MEVIFFVIAWATNRICLIPDSYIATKVVHSFGLHIFLLTIIYYNAYTTPYKQISKKVLWAILSFYETFAITVYAIVQTYVLTKFSTQEILNIWANKHIGAVARVLPGFEYVQDLFLPLLLIFLYTVYRRMHKLDYHKSEIPKDDSIFLVFIYPKNIIGLFLVLFSSIPASSVGLYYNGFFYGFTKKSKQIVKKEIDINSKEYFFKNTNIKDKQTVQKLLGTKWKPWKNCLNVFNPIIGKITDYI